jgi:hypothetical protein
MARRSSDTSPSDFFEVPPDAFGVGALLFRFREKALHVLSVLLIPPTGLCISANSVLEGPDDGQADEDGDKKPAEGYRPWP